PASGSQGSGTRGGPVDVLVSAVAGLVRVRGDRHAVADNVAVDVSDVLGGGDLRVRQDEAATLVAVLHVKHEHARREGLLVVRDSDVAASDRDVVLAVNLLQNLSLIRLKELQGRGLRELRLHGADNLPTPRTNVIGGTITGEGNALVTDQAQRNNARGQGAGRVGRKVGIERASSHTASSSDGSADHRLRKCHSVVLSRAPTRTKKGPHAPCDPSSCF